MEIALIIFAILVIILAVIVIAAFNGVSKHNFTDDEFEFDEDFQNEINRSLYDRD